ncbi:hypothetical protein B0P06_000551 [Clostridium saccharoperbutylacetonicum]|nr:hypothetical protein [Clostridium saccharoperbutylacetonicum]
MGRIYDKADRVIEQHEKMKLMESLEVMFIIMIKQIM